MTFRLIILSGPLKGRQLAVEKEPVSLGRDAGCTLVLDDEEVAGKQAVLEQQGSGLSIRDLDSSGRTLVNREPVGKARVKHGDVIEIGQTRLFVEAVRSTGVDGSGLWILNQVLTLLAFVAVPIAFLCLVAFLEETYLGIGGRAAGRTASAQAVTNSAGKEANGPASPGVDDAGEWVLPGLTNSRAIDASRSFAPAWEASVNADGGRPKQAAASLTNREQGGVADLADHETPWVEDFKKPPVGAKVVRADAATGGARQDEL